MGYYEDILAGKKKIIADILTGQPGEIDTATARTRDYFSGRDAEAANGTRDILTGISSTYGIDPSIVRAGQEQAQQTQKINKDKRESTLSYNRMKSLSDAYQRNYTYALSQYRSAGYDQAQAEAFARAWAKQKQDQDFQASQAQTARDVATEKNRISNLYSDVMGNMNVDEGNPYQEAMIRSLAGLAPYAAYAYMSKPKTPKGSGQTFSNPLPDSELPNSMNWRNY